MKDASGRPTIDVVVDALVRMSAADYLIALGRAARLRRERRQSGKQREPPAAPAENVVEFRR